jgi:hypothetical protein
MSGSLAQKTKGRVAFLLTRDAALRASGCYVRTARDPRRRESGHLIALPLAQGKVVGGAHGFVVLVAALAASYRFNTSRQRLKREGGSSVA